jgi:flagellar motility protein MotE (MotC chaperone)
VNRLPRILPLVGVAVGGVLAINALAGARDLPGLLSGARAYAEEAAAKPTGKPVKADAKAKKSDKPAEAAAKTDAVAPNAPGAPSATGAATDAAATSALPPPTLQPKAVCAPTAAELAKEAGLSPAELQVLQNLGQRRGELDQREAGMSTQIALLAAAEAKLDAKIKVMTSLRGDVQNLLTQADGREATEVDRLVKVYEGMKPKDAAARMAILEDAVRLPIAAKMKERALSAVIGQMPAQDAKKLTESLAHRFSKAQTLAQTATAQADAAAAATPAPADPNAKAPPAKAKPKRQAAKAAPRKKAPAEAQAAADPAPAKPAAAAPAPAAAAAPPKAG